MALVVYNRVQETTTTTGTGTITLAGAVSGFQSFAVVGNGNTTYYTITSGTAWEVGIGTYTSSGTTLARTTVLSNSLGTTAAISLTGTSNVFVTYPSEKSIYQDASGNVNPLGTIASGTWQGTAIGSVYGGTGFATYTTGDIIYASATNTLSKLPAGTNGYVLTLASGVPSWANPSSGSTLYTRTSFTATAGQTTFTASYTVGYVEVYANGVLLNGTDYTATSGTNIVLAVGSAAGDIIETLAFNTGVITISNLTGGSAGVVPYQSAGSTTSFTAVGTSGQPLLSGGTGSPTWGTLSATVGGTAQTTYTTGDILYASASNTLSKLAVGTAGQKLCINSGIPDWESSNSGSVFTTGTSATYTVPIGVTRVKVTIQGPGGTGGSGTAARATGGSAGGTCIKWLTVVPGDTMTYTVGTATGTNSTVIFSGITYTAATGAAGTNTAYAASQTAGPAGGTATNGDINITGQSGGTSYGTSTTVATNFSGQGGNSQFGQGGQMSAITGLAGKAATGYGAGGGGALNNATGGAASGGIIIFEPY